MAPESQMPPLILAYLGDAVYELWVREHLVHRGLCKVNDLHRTAVRYVNAQTQSLLSARLEPLLSPEELQVWKQGRNAKGGRQPKNMEMIDYRRATGLESLVGHLYLKGERGRLETIFQLLVQLVESDQEV